LFVSFLVQLVARYVFKWKLITFFYKIVTVNQYVFYTVSPYYKTKLKGLYTTAMQDAESEIE